MNCPSCATKLEILNNVSKLGKQFLYDYCCHQCQLYIQTKTYGKYHPYRSQYEELPYQKNKHQPINQLPYKKSPVLSLGT